MVQVLTYSGKETYLQGNRVTINSIHSPKSLDEFKINIVLLNDEKIWRNKEDSLDTCDIMKDFISLSMMIKNSRNTNILILYPQNQEYMYDYWSTRKSYMKRCELKDMLNNMSQNIIGAIYSPLRNVVIMYENTTTNVNGKKMSASFNFIDGESILLSEGSKKKTLVKMNNVYVSTLDIKNYEQLMALLDSINILNEKQEIPDWLDDIKMFDDEKQTEIINKSLCVIQEENRKINDANNALEKNRHYKSILYTNGDNLVGVTFEILENMLGCDLSEFEDVKKEDFLFTLGNHVFIGEIKGVTHNVKNENVSQLDVHYQAYLDANPETNSENISAVLIMNHQRNKSIEQREGIHENQIKLAERNGSLIIDTVTLLKMYEKFLRNELTREQCIDMIKINKGLLVI